MRHFLVKENRICFTLFDEKHLWLLQRLIWTKKRQLTKMMHKIRLWGLWCTAGNLLRRCKRCKKVHISSDLLRSFKMRIQEMKRNVIGKIVEPNYISQIIFKGCLSLFNYFIDMRPEIMSQFFCQKTMFFPTKTCWLIET